MKTLEFGIGTTLSKIISSLKGIEDKEVTVIIPKESPLLENPLNLKILEKIATDLGKNLQFAEGVKAILSTQESVQEQTESESSPATAIPVPERLNEIKTSGFKLGFSLRPMIENVKRFLPNRLRRSSSLLIGAVALVGLIGGYFFVENVPTAKVNLYLDSQTLDKELTITGSPLVSSVDPDKKVIPLTPLTATKESSDSAKTSGKKTTGNPASGTITIRNYNTVTAKTFPKGTILKATGNLEGAKYTLDQAVTIPIGTSSSRIDSSGKKINETDPGRKDASITASEVGSKYNAEGGQTFVVGTEGFENVNGVASSGLSGGTSKEVTVVSETDVSNLVDKVTKDLTGKVKQEFSTKLSTGQNLVEGSNDVKVLKKDVTPSIGTEADSFNLSMELSLTGYAYTQTDLEELIKKAVESSVPSGYEIAQGANISAEVIKSPNKDKETTLLAKLKGSAVTKVDKDALINNLKGKPLDQAENYLRSQSNISGFEIVLSPSLPGFLNKIPSNPGKIKIEVVKKTG